MSNLLNYIDMFSTKSERELDEEIFKGTEYEGIDFVRESGWDNYDNLEYASPVFRFENGDRVAVDKQGKIIIIKDKDMKKEFRTGIFTFGEKKPQDGETCWVVCSIHAYPTLHIYNEASNCWDDADGDDYECDVCDDDVWCTLPTYRDMARE